MTTPSYLKKSGDQADDSSLCANFDPLWEGITELHSQRKTTTTHTPDVDVLLACVILAKPGKGVMELDS